LFLFRKKQLCFIFGLLLLFSLNCAQAKVVKLKIRMTTPVYKSASFDAKVIGKLKRGAVVYGTDKPRPSGFGYFHKVRLRKKVYGYIPDTAVEGFKKKGKLISDLKRATKKERRKNKSARGGISGRAGVKKKSIQ